MLPVSAETTVSASKQAHLPSNMLSVPQAEQCTAQPGKRPPTGQMAEPRNTGSRARMRTDHRRQEGWWRKSEDVPVKLHFTVTGKQSHGFPSVLLSFLPPSLLSFLSFP